MALFAALVFTVALLVTTAYFLMGGLPLLILQHDTPLDARFIRGFFHVYFVAAMAAAAGAAVSYALLGRPGFAVGAAGIGVAAAVLRRTVLPRMDRLREQMLANDLQAIRRFRRFHLALLGGNLAQLVLLVWSLTKLSV
ncbi:MAG: hypothetical protein HY855_22280 [Burkholderiales bacterium]|nr:hypothetical protein [Burkholderiales bacterium]